eukprot:1118598_1
MVLNKKIKSMALLCWLLTLLYCVICTHSKKLVVYSMSSDFLGLIRAQELAAQQINDDDRLLSNYEIELRSSYDDTTSWGPKGATAAAIDLVNNVSAGEETNSSVIIPMILGPTLSNQVIATAQIFYNNDFGILSDSATSMALTNQYLYPYFYRVRPSDDVQCKAIVELCTFFDWDSIVVVYSSHEFAMYMANEILELSAQNNIKAHSVRFESRMYHEYYKPNATDLPFKETATFIKSLEVYIIVLIDVSPDILKAFMVEELWGYPYYFIGIEAWFKNVASWTTRFNWSESPAQGFISPVPWRPDSLPADYYGADLQMIRDKALYYEELLKTSWDNSYEYIEYNVPDLALYGWDSMYTLAHALNEYDKQYSIEQSMFTVFDSSQILRDLDVIMCDQVQFLGVTGDVTFDDIGNRQNGSMDYFGYIYKNITKINQDDIVWPSYFDEKGMIPRSNKLITHELIRIKPMLFTVICVFVCVSVVLVLLVASITIYFRQEPLLVNGSWRLNIFVCFGCLLAYAEIILQGLDGMHCNIRIGLLCIAFSVIFMPLFMKTYRLARIFNSMQVQTITDCMLMSAVMACVLVDVILLSIFILIEPFYREYRTGSIMVIDALQEIQYTFGVCTRANATTVYFVMGFWKLLELMFGIYVTAIVSRIGLNALIKFDETGQHVFAITFTVFATTIIVTYALASNNSDKINEKYAIMSGGILIICSLSLIVNTFFRLRATYYAKIKKDDTKLKQFEETFESTVMKMIEMQMQNIQARTMTVGGEDQVANDSSSD